MFLGLGCEPCSDTPHEFEKEEYGVDVFDVRATMDRLEVSELSEVTCEDLCYKAGGGEYSSDFGVTDCEMDLDPEIFDSDLESLNGSLEVGTLICSGYFIALCKD